MLKTTRMTLLVLGAVLGALAGVSREVTAQVQAPAAPASQPAKELTLDLGGGVTMEFVLIRPGWFLMGSNNGLSDEKPVHKVTISKAFYLAKTPTTQEQWHAVMGTNPSNFKGAKNPVEEVTWYDCQAFNRKLAEKVGRRLKCHLPTEAQWEYACRAGSTGNFCYGDDETRLGDYAWFRGNTEDGIHPSGMTHPVAQKKPNAWGLYDMHGNVWEWCEDWKGEYPSGEVTDPTGAPSGSSRVCRGGSFMYPPRFCRSASRPAGPPRIPNWDLGFRVVLDLPE
jgi:formylglycine-generating enzyme required for sulfatase activity